MEIVVNKEMKFGEMLLVNTNKIKNEIETDESILSITSLLKENVNLIDQFIEESKRVNKPFWDDIQQMVCSSLKKEISKETVKRIYYSIKDAETAKVKTSPLNKVIVSAPIQSNKVVSPVVQSVEIKKEAVASVEYDIDKFEFEKFGNTPILIYDGQHVAKFDLTNKKLSFMNDKQEISWFLYRNKENQKVTNLMVRFAEFIEGVTNPDIIHKEKYAKLKAFTNIK